jgi:pyridoxal phosphate enzyme (YggS family)
MNVEMDNRLGEIRRRMEQACERAGRDPATVQLLAISKTQGPEAIVDAVQLGVTQFGENKVQEARQKIPQSPSAAKWHFVGHLQTNKAREAVRLFEMVHAVDSLKLLETLDRVCQEEGRTLPVCLEVNVSGERSKFGLPPEEVPLVLKASQALFRVRIVGVMTIPPIAEDPEEARPFFRRLRELRDRWQSESGILLPELSMGMSHDFEVAIEEGATWIRVGTLLFGERRKVVNDESA